MVSDSDSDSPPTATDVQNSLKRRITQLQDENKRLAKGKRQPSDRETTLARAICKVVSLHVPLNILINENDRRLDPDEVEEVDDTVEGRRLTREQDRNFTSFKELESLFGKGFLVRVLEKDDFLNRVKAWAKHTADSRGNDIKNGKTNVPNWLNTLDRLEVTPEGETPDFVNPYSRTRRGFKNNITGNLLCPIQLNWNDLEVRRKIKDMDGISFPANQQYYPRMLYAGYAGNPMLPHRGYLQSTLLVRMFKSIFTSHTSAIKHYGEDRIVPSSGSESDSMLEPPRKRQRQRPSREPTKKNVASLIGMTRTTARAIAYAAVILHFSLSSAQSWNIDNDGLSYASFYDFIIDYIEVLSLKKHREELLAWWDRQVFNRPKSSTSPDDVMKEQDDMALREVFANCAEQAARISEKRAPVRQGTLARRGLE